MHILEQQQGFYPTVLFIFLFSFLVFLPSFITFKPGNSYMGRRIILNKWLGQKFICPHTKQGYVPTTSMSLDSSKMFSHYRTHSLKGFGLWDAIFNYKGSFTITILYFSNFKMFSITQILILTQLYNFILIN